MHYASTMFDRNLLHRRLGAAFLTLALLPSTVHGWWSEWTPCRADVPHTGGISDSSCLGDCGPATRFRFCQNDTLPDGGGNVAINRTGGSSLGWVGGNATSSTRVFFNTTTCANKWSVFNITTAHVDVGAVCPRSGLEKQRCGYYICKPCERDSPCAKRIAQGENCRIGSRVSIGENTPHEPTVVGEDCHICRGSLVKENVVVGKNVSIGGCKEEYVITQGTGSSSTSGHNGTNSTGNSTATNSSANSDMASPRTVIIAGNRIGDNVIIGYKVKMVGSVMRPIGSNTVIGDDTKLIDPDVGANTIIGDGVQCVKSSIGHNVVTGSGSAIIHTAMGNGSTVTPNATVTTCTIERGVMITGSHFTCNGATLVAGVSITGNNVTANCKDVNLAFIPPDNYASDNTNLTCHASANPDADQRNNARVYGAAGGSVGALVLVATAGMGAHFYRKHLKAKAKAQVRSTNVRLDIETASCDLPINHLVGQDKTHEDTPEYDHIFDSDQPMPEWPPEMVYQWVRNQPMEVSRYAHLFTDHSISGTVLCELPKEELERRFVKMGITLTGPRTLLLTLVAHELEQQKAAQKPRKTFGKITGDSSTSNPSLNIYMEPEDLAGNKRPSTNSIPVIDGDYLAVTNYAERKSSSLSQTGDQPTEGEQSETGSTEISRDINQQAESLYLEMPKMV